MVRKILNVKFYRDIFRYSELELRNCRTNGGMVTRLLQKIGLLGGPWKCYRNCTFLIPWEKSKVKQHIGNYKFKYIRFVFVQCQFIRVSARQLHRFDKQISRRVQRISYTFHADTRTVQFEGKQFKLKDVYKIGCISRDQFFNGNVLERQIPATGTIPPLSPGLYHSVKSSFFNRILHFISGTNSNRPCYLR